MNYYRIIGRKKYDKEMIAVADEAVAGRGDGRISLEDARLLLASVKDANKYTDIEKRTMRYIRDHYRFTIAADQWFRTEIRKWAATKSLGGAFLFRKKVDPPAAEIAAPERQESAQQEAPVLRETPLMQEAALARSATPSREFTATVKRTKSRGSFVYWALALGGASLLMAWFFLISPQLPRSPRFPEPPLVIKNEVAAPVEITAKPAPAAKPEIVVKPEPKPAPAAKPEIVVKPEPKPAVVVTAKIVIPKPAKKSAVRARKVVKHPVVGRKSRVYTTKAGNTLWGIAGAMYSDPFLWPVLLRANRKLGRNPDVIPPRLKINVPALIGKPSTLSSADHRQVAEGYAYAYLAYKKAGNPQARSYLRAALRQDPTVIKRLPQLRKP